MANRSVFPQQLDTFVQLRDLTPELSQDADELKELMKISNKSSEQISRMNELLVELQDYYMSTETWNKLCDCIVNMENFTLQKFTTYYRYRQTYDNSISYDLFNSVRYTDGNIYMLYTTLPSYQAGINPTDTNYWLKLSNKGDKGDKGNQWKGNYDSVTNYLIDDVIAFDGSSYICIQSCNNKQPDINPTYWQLFAKRGYSGIDGKDGVNFVPKGEYSDIVTYNKDNAVQYQGSLYVCKQDGVTGFPPTNTQYWYLGVAKGGSVTVATLRNTVTITTNTSNVKFFGGEITAFNPSLDSLFVYVNTTYKEKGEYYTINIDGMSIDCVDGSWDGTQTPITFNFVVIKNIVQTINFNDGTLIQNGSINEDKLTQDVKNKLNNNFFNLIETSYTAISDGISHVLLGHSNYNPNEDKLTVKYMNEILTKNLNYTINSDNLSIDLVDWTLDKNDTIYFETIKRSLNVIIEPDGSLIADKTISEAKLSQGLQDKINSKANQTDLDTTNTNISNLDNTVNTHLADYSTDIGVSNAYKINITPSPTSYEIGKVYKFKAINANTGASTFQINSLPVVNIKKNVSIDLVNGDIIAGQIILVVYDGTNMQMIGVSGITSAEKTNFNNHLNALVTDTNGVHGLKIEEGWFTPVITDNSNNQVVSYSIRSGYYHRIGNRVFYEIFVIISTKGSSLTGVVYLGGLPFASRNLNGVYYNVAIGEFDKITRGTQILEGYLAPTEAKLVFRLCGDNLPAVPLNASNLTDGSALQLSGNYLI